MPKIVSFLQDALFSSCPAVGYSYRLQSSQTKATHQLLSAAVEAVSSAAPTLSYGVVAEFD